MSTAVKPRAGACQVDERNDDSGDRSSRNRLCRCLEHGLDHPPRRGKNYRKPARHRLRGSNCHKLVLLSFSNPRRANGSSASDDSPLNRPDPARSRAVHSSRRSPIGLNDQHPAYGRSVRTTASARPTMQRGSTNTRTRSCFTSLTWSAGYTGPVRSNSETRKIPSDPMVVTTMEKLHPSPFRPPFGGPCEPPSASRRARQDANGLSGAL